MWKKGFRVQVGGFRVVVRRIKKWKRRGVFDKPSSRIVPPFLRKGGGRGDREVSEQAVNQGKRGQLLLFERTGFLFRSQPH